MCYLILVLPDLDEAAGVSELWLMEMALTTYFAVNAGQRDPISLKMHQFITGN